MHQKGRNCFRWPDPQDKHRYSFEDILTEIQPPTPSNQRGGFSFPEDELKNLEKLFQENV